MTIAAFETAIPSGKSSFRKEYGGTEKRKSLTPDERFSAPSHAMTEENPASLEAFETFKDRLKALGWSQRDFAEYIGVHGSTMGKWRGSVIPLYAIRLVDEMERHVVSPAWRGGKGRADPTTEDARDALRRATTTTVDEAIKRGWSRAQIAGALRSFADETEGTKRGE